MKFLKFEQQSNRVVTITNHAKMALGSIHPKGEVFSRSRVFVPFDEMTEWTSECLREVADFMDSLESRERLPNRQATAKVRKPKRPAHI